MLFLVCLFFIICSYASEDISLLTINNTEDAPSFLIKAREKYKYAQEHCESGQVYFYNPIKKTVESFEPKDKLTNLFLEIDHIPVSTIIQSAEIQNCFEKNQTTLNLQNNFDLLFKSLSTLDFSLKEKSKFLYHFKRFLYVIESNNSSSMQATSYDDFLQLTKKWLNNMYYTEIQSFQTTVFCSGGLVTATFTGLGLGLSVVSPNSVPIIFASCIPFPISLFAVAGGLYLRKYFVYKKCLKTIKSLKKESLDSISIIDEKDEEKIS